MRARHALLAVAAGLVLADASIVTLALPELLVDLHTTVDGVAAIIGVYTVVLAAALLPAERLSRTHGPAAVGTVGFAIFALASVVCALSGSLPLLLAGRAIQAAGGAAGLVCAFEALTAGRHPTARTLWLGAAVLSAAAGPALGGALTQAFSWQAIFWAQAPLAAIGAVLLRDEPAFAQPAADLTPREPIDPRAAAALALVSAALTAILFLLVLLLVAGWAVSPLGAAATVTILPAAALCGSRIRGDARWRAAAGCALVGLATWTLAELPDAHVAWTFVPQILGGVGMGLALPALGGELLPERDARDAAVLLTLRHVGIAAALALLAPITASKLDHATLQARERGVALVLDAKLAPTEKLSLAPALLQGVEQSSPRAGLRSAIAEERSGVSGDELAEYDRMAARADDTLVGAVSDSFFWAFVITGAFALLAAVLLVRPRRMPAWVPAAVAVACLALVVQTVERHHREPQQVVIRDPCKPRPLPSTGGVTGFLQDRALQLLDRTACHLGSSREELVLALADSKDAKRFQREHGTNPRSVGTLLGALLGG